MILNSTAMNLPAASSDPLIGMSWAARIIGVSHSQVRRFVLAGRLIAEKTSIGHVMRLSDVQAFARARRERQDGAAAAAGDQVDAG